MGSYHQKKSFKLIPIQIKPPEIIYKRAGERLNLKHLNLVHLERIASFLPLSEMVNLAVVNKRVFELFKD